MAEDPVALDRPHFPRHGAVAVEQHSGDAQSTEVPSDPCRGEAFTRGAHGNLRRPGSAQRLVH